LLKELTVVGGSRCGVLLKELTVVTYWNVWHGEMNGKGAGLLVRTPCRYAEEMFIIRWHSAIVWPLAVHSYAVRCASTLRHATRWRCHHRGACWRVLCSWHGYVCLSVCRSCNLHISLDLSLEGK
jgi:hypothetical protein